MSLKTSPWVSAAFSIMWAALVVYAVTALIRGSEETSSAVLWLLIGIGGITSMALSHRARVRAARGGTKARADPGDR